ncbi:LB_137 family protein [Leptospira bouyouniensis]|uniref:LB_137 family protein n=1 Tax=Leptospira bouyouniensis TaxID=2484911 RepID=UPI00109128B2|nr:hypothetical protein EHQ99_13710 [Leptospira bouyouniensis]
MVLKFHIIKIREFCLTLLLLGWVLPGSILQADKIRLKSGEVLNGKVQNVTPTHVEWMDQGKRYKFPNEDVIGIDVGYDGLPACADYKTFGVEDCDLILTRLTKTNASFSKKSSPLELETIPIKKITTLKIKKESGLPVDRYIQFGAKGKWNFVGKEIIGIYKSIDRGKMLIETDEKKLETADVLDFESFEYQNKSVIAKVIKEETPKVIPGFASVSEKKYGKAALLFGTALVSGIGMAYEYNMSVKAINQDIEYIPTGDGRVFLFSNTLGNDRYDFHRQRFTIYAAIFATVLTYSFIDSFYLGQRDSNKEGSQAVYLKPIIDFKPNANLYYNIPSFQRPNEFMSYGFSFESKF